ncbi:MAG: sigma-70 family RNA polymerase sigma factor [Myxococcota bacterium]
MHDEPEQSDERDEHWRAWMIGAQDGDAAAYERLLREILPRARRQVGARVPDVAAREDIVQNALVSLHRSRHTYRPDRPFSPWFRAIVRNAIVDWTRARGRTAQREFSIEPESLSAATPELAEPRAQEDLSPELEHALASLPVAQRQAVELIHVEELSVAEAASRAGVSPGALKVRAHRGYRALRALLERGDR